MQDVLYHAVSYQNALTAFRRNSLRGHSTHRIHDNGTVPWPSRSFRGQQADANKMKAYLESKWMFGLCLTRSPHFAHSWNDVVLVLDRQALRNRFELKPYNWFETRVKGEFEEFLITGKTGWEQGRFDTSLSDETRAKKYGLAVKELKTQAKFFRDDDSYVGEVENLHRYVKEVRLVCSEKVRFPEKPGWVSSSVSTEYAVKQFDKYFGSIFDWCQRYGIPLKII